jgi:hypothetical protein
MLLSSLPLLLPPFPSSLPILPPCPFFSIFLIEQAEEVALQQEQEKILRRPQTKISLSLKKKGALF